MYLADVDIRERLSVLAFEASHEGYPFEASKQIQPCSIDLRLDNVIWRAGKKGIVDLHRSLVDSIQPRRGWRASLIPDGGSIIIHPGQTVFARVYERFRMPPDLAGKLEGRSSFARLGLMVHCSQDFINPGWYGHMPLQLFNAGPHALRIPPFTHVCQLILVKLTSEPERTYGHGDLDSKYMNDDGGPSFWWRDRRIKELHEKLVQKSLPAAIERRLAELTEGREVEIIERFQVFVDEITTADARDPERVIDVFARKEGRRRTFRAIFDWFSRGAFVLLGGILATNIEAGQTLMQLWKLLTVTAVATVLSLYSVIRPKTGYLLPENVERARLEASRRKELPPATQNEEPGTRRDPRVR